MMGIHHCQYHGTAFYIQKEKVVQTFVKSRVVVDAPYFREENPNYARPSVKESDKGDGLFIIGDDTSSAKPSSVVESNGMDPSEVKGDDLLICSPTVPGYSLGNKHWGERLIPSSCFRQLMPWCSGVCCRQHQRDRLETSGIG